MWDRDISVGQEINGERFVSETGPALSGGCLALEVDAKHQTESSNSSTDRHLDGTWTCVYSE